MHDSEFPEAAHDERFFVEAEALAFGADTAGIDFVEEEVEFLFAEGVDEGEEVVRGVDAEPLEVGAIGRQGRRQAGQEFRD